MSTQVSQPAIEQMLSKYGERAKLAAEQIELWRSGEIPFSHPETISKLLADATPDLLFDSFWRTLPFGTGGRRGTVGYGPNRFNESVVAVTVQGHCNFLRTKFGNGKLLVVVANDVRKFDDSTHVYSFLGTSHPLLGVSSRTLARLACEIYAGNNISVVIAEPASLEAVMTTPMLSYAIRKIGAVGGVNLSASHNPPDDNGIKLYDHTGAQPVPPLDQELTDLMAKPLTVQSLPFDEALQQGLVQALADDVERDYFEAYFQLRSGMSKGQIPIVYTPLCGAGLSTAGAVLHQSGYQVATPPNEGPDGSFAAIPLRAPNPEVVEATRPAKTFAEKIGAKIVLASDPDADRVGLDVLTPGGNWWHFDGNQIAATLAYYLMLDPLGPRRKGLVVETVVTTRLVGTIAKMAGGCSLVDDLYVGFKYISNILQELTEKGRFRNLEGRPDDIILAAEESHGALVTEAVRDKDATGPCLFLAELHERLDSKGLTLVDYYVEIMKKCGVRDSVLRSVMLRGADGIGKRDAIMESLRSQPPTEIGGQEVTKVRDYWDEKEFGPFLSETDWSARNMVELETKDSRVVVRPSGTEPKLKLYYEALLADPPLTLEGLPFLLEVRRHSEIMSGAAYRDILRRIGVTLGNAALRLPDIIDLDRKVAFEQEFLPKLQTYLHQREKDQASPDSLEQTLEWLRKEAAFLVPGTDPVPALRDALSEACGEWSTATPNPLLTQLKDWCDGK